MNIVFISPPLAGKGTQSSRLKNILNIPHISTGSLLRKKAKDTDELAFTLRDLISRGELVDDNLMIEIIKERIALDDCKNGYILDGFPRTINQAELYEKLLIDMNLPLGKVIYLNITYDVAVARINGRLTCETCGAVYNSFNEETKPLKEDTCDACNSTLVKRADDNVETLLDRFTQYNEKTAPLIEYYREKGNIYEFDSSKEPSTVTQKIVELVRGNID